MNVSQFADVSNNKKEEATKFEEELKFLEAWLETPCFDEVSIEVAPMNVKDNMDDVENEEAIKLEEIAKDKYKSQEPTTMLNAKSQPTIKIKKEENKRLSVPHLAKKM